MTIHVIEHIESRPGVCGGKPCIAGRRIPIHHIVTWHEELGISADEIAEDLELTLGQVYAALSYYHDHREEIDEIIRREDELDAQPISEKQRQLMAKWRREIDARRAKSA